MVCNEYDFDYNITAFFPCLQLICGKEYSKKNFPELQRTNIPSSAA